mmetsp:Transcript_18024/g.30712  ORF Transcript_18024/g.30712 Transcript_18024/m.30712 type:complete len:104 (-) Transcript_18024:1822-2133(-)
MLEEELKSDELKNDLEQSAEAGSAKGSRRDSFLDSSSRKEGLKGRRSMLEAGASSSDIDASSQKSSGQAGTKKKGTKVFKFGAQKLGGLLTQPLARKSTLKKQ